MTRFPRVCCKSFLRIAWTQFRLSRCRIIVGLALGISLCIVTFLSYGVALTKSDVPYSDPNIPTPIVRLDSWDRRFNRRGLSYQGVDSNMDVTLLVLIHASGNSIGRKRRDVIRRTWISDLVLSRVSEAFGTRVTYKFVLGGKDLSQDAYQRLSMESHLYKDMIFLDGVTDEHSTLTQRTLYSFTYIIENEYQFEYILKCDDDTFVDLKAIVSYLVNRSDSPLHWGSFVGGYDILSEGPYAENAWYICDKYLPYAFGGGYIISRDLIELLAMNSPYLRHYSNEDVSVSAWLAPYNIERIHDLKFDTQADSHGCMRPFIVAHKISLAKMKEYFISLQTEGIMCGERTRTHHLALLTHYYDWKAFPIRECCSDKRAKQLHLHQPYV